MKKAVIILSAIVLFCSDLSAQRKKDDEKILSITYNAFGGEMELFENLTITKDSVHYLHSTEIDRNAKIEKHFATPVEFLDKLLNDCDLELMSKIKSSDDTYPAGTNQAFIIRTDKRELYFKNAQYDDVYRKNYDYFSAIIEFAYKIRNEFETGYEGIYHSDCFTMSIIDGGGSKPSSVLNPYKEPFGGWMYQYGYEGKTYIGAAYIGESASGIGILFEKTFTEEFDGFIGVFVGSKLIIQKFEENDNVPILDICTKKSITLEKE